MPPAARMGDATSHGKPLSPGPGSTDVLIGNKPAWRVGSDFHVCPQQIPAPTPIPHVGGTVAVGSMTVFINNLPAARQGDMIIEAGPPDSITAGETTVIIG